MPVATVLTACGIETNIAHSIPVPPKEVATVLTACGIETSVFVRVQHASFALQQYLPLAVLKLKTLCKTKHFLHNVVATVLTACGIET